MTYYTDFNEFKQKIKSILPGFVFFIGIILSFSCISTIITGISIYKEDIKKIDWIKTTAEIISVDERLTTSGEKYTVYDISYRYTVDDIVYSGLYTSISKQKAGNSLEIKYDPNSPDDSTHIMEPRKDYIESAVFLGTLGAICIIGPFLIKKLQKNILNRKRTGIHFEEYADLDIP